VIRGARSPARGRNRETYLPKTTKTKASRSLASLYYIMAGGQGFEP
jgi:hypothetical protein